MEKAEETTKENNPTLTNPMKNEIQTAEVFATRLRVTANATMNVVLMFIPLRTKSTAPLVVAAISGIRLAIALAPVSRGVGKDVEKEERKARRKQPISVCSDRHRSYIGASWNADSTIEMKTKVASISPQGLMPKGRIMSVPSLRRKGCG